MGRVVLTAGSLIAVCLTLSLSSTGALMAEELPFAAPGQAIVEFERDVIDLPIDPGVRFIPLNDVPIDLPDLERGLDDLGVTEFQILAPFWRRVEPPPPSSEDYVPPHLISFRDVYVLHFPRELDLATTLEVLEGLPGVRLVTPNHLMTLMSPGYWPEDEYLTMPPDSSRAYQWNMENTGGVINGVQCIDGVDIGLRGAYEIQSKCTVKIGFADTGCDSDHEDLEESIDTELARDFTSGDPADWEDTRGHGTQTAGILGALHSLERTGVAGICGRRDPDSTVLVPLKVWPDQTGTPDHGDSIATYLIDALDYDSGLYPTVPIVVVETALQDAGWGPISGMVPFLRNAVFNSYHTGIFLPTAAGNNHDGRARNAYPVAFRHMTTGVTAVGCDGSREDGFWTRSWIDLSAPSSANLVSGDGGIPQIVTTKMGGGYAGIGGAAFYGGTSAATPHVGGAAGLLLSHTAAMTNEDLGELLTRTARDLGETGYDSTYGYGLLRVDSALAQLERFVFVQDSTDQIDDWDTTAVKRVQYFKNIQIVAPTVFTPDFSGEDYTEVRADVYEFETTVTLSENSNSGHIPLVWARGRESVSARDTLYYDGYFEPYTAQVAEVTADEAVIRGHTYHLWSPDSSKSFGWYPLKLPRTGGTMTIFSFSYLADTTSGDSPREGSSIHDLRLRGRRTICTWGKSARIEFWAPGGQPTTLEVFDLTGRRVVLLTSPARERGSWRELVWGGLDDRRRPVPAGVYFGKVRQGGAAARVSFPVVR